MKDEQMEKEEQEQEETRPLMVHSISSSLVKEFKILCLKKEITMQDGLAKAIRGYIDDHKE